MDKLIGFLKDLHPEVDFEAENALIDAGILDSFDIVTIVSEIGDAYDVQIPVEELTPENFNSAKALLALVRRLADR